jgi:exopolyphosphatase/guanosine-5'-triphosphate,3'-diphosphate pyrophosphatase
VLSSTDLKPLVFEERITRLGQNLQKTKKLSPDAISRVVKTLEEYNEIISNKSALISDVATTSAARDAINQQELLKTIKDTTGLNCRVLSGDEEAGLTLLGVQGAFSEDTNLFVCDVGGGSTEFIASERQGKLKKVSINIGSRRLTEQFFHHDPVERIETAALRKFLIHTLLNELADFPELEWNCIATGGTASTLALIDLERDISQVDRAHGHKLVNHRLDSIIEKLTRKSIEERKEIRGLHPDRADVILAGALILRALQAYWHVSTVTVSNWDLLHGMLLK